MKRFMNDIFNDMQIKTESQFISDLPYKKDQILEILKGFPLERYEKRQMEDFSKFIFNLTFDELKKKL